MNHRNVVIFDKDDRCLHCYASPLQHYGWCLAKLADRIFDAMRIDPSQFPADAEYWTNELGSKEGWYP